jgi:hypothetical protein
MDILIALGRLPGAPDDREEAAQVNAAEDAKTQQGPDVHGRLHRHIRREL